jgi:hypothetical protein
MGGISVTTTPVRSEQLQAFHHHGYCLLPAALPATMLAMLRAECATAIENVHGEMDRQGVNVIGGSRRGLQYTPGNCRQRQPALRTFLLSDLMNQICTSLIGPAPYLVWDQFSVKHGTTPNDPNSATFTADGNPQSLGRFSWHQDSGYIPHDHAPYLTCWIALDDITLDNGPLAVIPFPEIGITTRVTHRPDPDNGDLVGYFGTLPGKSLPVPQGSIVCFSSTLFHSSRRNTTAAPRRAYLAQYSSTVTAADGTAFWPDAEPFAGHAATSSATL